MGPADLKRLAQRLLQVVGVAHLRVVDDSGDQQTAQLQIMAGGPEGIEEIIDKTPRLGAYGFAYCPPDGSEAIVLFVGGRRSAGVIVATGHRATRPKGLKPGEAMLYNGLTGDFVKLGEDGKIRSQSGDWVHTGDQHVSGTVFAAHVIPADGVSGVFTSQDGKTITVIHGIITRII